MTLPNIYHNNYKQHVYTTLALTIIIVSVFTMFIP